MSDRDVPRNEYRALLEVVMEQQKLVVNRLGQATENLSRFSSEQERQARTLTSIGAEVGKIQPQMGALAQRLDDIDRRLDSMHSDIRSANSEIITQNNQIINAIDSALHNGADIQAIEERISMLEQRFS